MIKNYKFNNISSNHYLNPGKNLEILDLVRLYRSLLKINMDSKSPVDNLFIKDGLTYEELKKVYANCLITIFEDEKSPFGFLISPIIKSKRGYVLHAGLVMLNRNPGGDFLSLAALTNYTTCFTNYGSFYTTNISSTPSIVETFTKIVKDAWPSPKMNLKYPPSHYREVIQALKKEYIDNYFPTNSKVEINLKRFTMTSDSEKMGFSTNYYNLSRARDYMFQTFCKSWIDYNKGEDIIQVGRMTLATYIYQLTLLFFIKIKMNKLHPVEKNELETTKEQKAA